MTRGGKIMTGVGIGLAAAGGVVLIGTATMRYTATSTDRHELYGIGGATRMCPDQRGTDQGLIVV